MNDKELIINLYEQLSLKAIKTLTKWNCPFCKRKIMFMNDHACNCGIFNKTYIGVKRYERIGQD